MGGNSGGGGNGGRSGGGGDNLSTGWNPDTLKNTYKSNEPAATASQLNKEAASASARNIQNAKENKFTTREEREMAEYKQRVEAARAKRKALGL